MDHMTISLGEALHNKIREHAFKQNLSKSEYVRSVLLKDIQKNGDQDALERHKK